MARTIQTKRVVHARLLKEYASWIYCTGCEKTVAYLCYVTYDAFDFSFTCSCGCKGSVYIDFACNAPAVPSDQALLPRKNRLCCPEDNTALLTLVEKNLARYKCRIVCSACGHAYQIQK